MEAGFKVFAFGVGGDALGDIADEALEIWGVGFGVEELVAGDFDGDGEVVLCAPLGMVFEGGRDVWRGGDGVECVDIVADNFGGGVSAEHFEECGVGVEDGAIGEGAEDAFGGFVEETAVAGFAFAEGGGGEIEEAEGFLGAEFCVVAGECHLDVGAQDLGLKGLEHVREGASFCGAVGNFDVRVCGNKDDGDVRLGAQGGGDVEAAEAGAEVHVHEDEVGVSGGNLGEGGFAAKSVSADVVAEVAEEVFEFHGDDGFILDNKHASHERYLRLFLIY